VGAEPVRDAQLYLEQEQLEGEIRALAGGVAAVCSIRSPGRDTPNQDAAALISVGESAAVLAVADGVGGVRSGGQASEVAVTCLAEALGGSAADAAGLRPAILDGIERGNRAARDLGVGAATTLAAVEVADGSVRPYHVGDSMILVVGQRGRVKLQTVAHSPVGFAVEAGVMDEKEAMHHEERHVVSNVLGAPDMRIEVGSARRLGPRDTVLVASDGVFDNLHLHEIVERIRKGPIQQAVRLLAQEALRRMTRPARGEPSKPDDLTFVLYRLDPARS
jgi:serine/threonine protein phosphatase PrpC